MTAAYERDREHSIDLVDCVLAKRQVKQRKPIESTYVSDGLPKSTKPLESTYVSIDPSREYIIPMNEFEQPEMSEPDPAK